ncbi:MAG: hypothetical protein ACUVUU_09265 [bacterium]
MIDKYEDEILIKDHTNVSYEMLLRKAEEEGRIGGKYKCPVCGMRFKNEKEAQECCKRIMK